MDADLPLLKCMMVWSQKSDQNEGKNRRPCKYGK